MSGLESRGGAGPALWIEHPVVLAGSQGPLVGILARPEGECRAAVLIVAGQPQTRVGAHRMFTELARLLAALGVASLRFDIGGWGDSPGEPQPFECSDRDIAAAATGLRAALPGERRLCLWGLCDGASAAVLALPALREAGVVPDAICLVNPWVRSEASLADAMVRTYYRKRVMQTTFWIRLLTGRIRMANLVHEPLRHLRTKLGRSAKRPAEGRDAAAAAPDLPAQLLAQLVGFRGEVYTVLSGNDLTAGETVTLMARDKRWRKRLGRKGALLHVPGADHTFSDPAQWDAVAHWVAEKARAQGGAP